MVSSLPGFSPSLGAGPSSSLGGIEEQKGKGRAAQWVEPGLLKLGLSGCGLVLEMALASLFILAWLFYFSFGGFGNFLEVMGWWCQSRELSSDVAL